MNFDLSKAIYLLSVAVVPVMLGMILHEIAHGWAALKMGDPTAKQLGRLNLNPVRHLDPLGTFCFVLTGVLSAAGTAPFIFGWAKPVPINFRLFRNIRLGVFVTSIAGAMANLLLALVFALLLGLMTFLFRPQPGAYGLSSSFLVNMCLVGMYANCTLAWFNLLPIPPLDGSKVLASLMPAKLAREFFRLERFGMLIVVLLLATNMLSRILLPVIQRTVDVMLNITGLIF